MGRPNKVRPVAVQQTRPVESEVVKSPKKGKDTLSINLDRPLRESFNDIKARVESWFDESGDDKLQRLVISLKGEEQAGARNKMKTILREAGLQVNSVDYTY